MELVVCVKCGEPLGRMSGIKKMIANDPKQEFLAQCSCGQKYNLGLLTSDRMILSFSDKEVEIIG